MLFTLKTEWVPARQLFAKVAEGDMLYKALERR